MRKYRKFGIQYEQLVTIRDGVYTKFTVVIDGIQRNPYYVPSDKNVNDVLSVQDVAKARMDLLKFLYEEYTEILI